MPDDMDLTGDDQIAAIAAAEEPFTATPLPHEEKVRLELLVVLGCAWLGIQVLAVGVALALESEKSAPAIAVLGGAGSVVAGFFGALVGYYTAQRFTSAER